ncbi:hypothetical protein HDU67_009227 [Dinochytrium kinnereticum]|nr:hypothetical protein HDU67_009227 [Dinochytrium kinnereticum]
MALPYELKDSGSSFQDILASSQLTVFGLHIGIKMAQEDIMNIYNLSSSAVHFSPVNIWNPEYASAEDYYTITSGGHASVKLYDKLLEADNVAEEVVGELEKQGLRTTSIFIPPEALMARDFRFQFSLAKRLRCKYFFVSMGNIELNSLYSSAVTVGMTGSDYLWMSYNSIIPTSEEENQVKLEDYFGVIFTNFYSLVEDERGQREKEFIQRFWSRAREEAINLGWSNLTITQLRAVYVNSTLENSHMAYDCAMTMFKGFYQILEKKNKTSLASLNELADELNITAFATTGVVRGQIMLNDYGDLSTKFLAYSMNMTSLMVLKKGDTLDKNFAFGLTSMDGTTKFPVEDSGSVGGIIIRIAQSFGLISLLLSISFHVYQASKGKRIENLHRLDRVRVMLGSDFALLARLCNDLRARKILKPVIDVTIYLSISGFKCRDRYSMGSRREAIRFVYDHELGELPKCVWNGAMASMLFALLQGLARRKQTKVFTFDNLLKILSAFYLTMFIMEIFIQGVIVKNIIQALVLNGSATIGNVFMFLCLIRCDDYGLAAIREDRVKESYECLDLGMISLRRYGKFGWSGQENPFTFSLQDIRSLRPNHIFAEERGTLEKPPVDLPEAATSGTSFMVSLSTQLILVEAATSEDKMRLLNILQDFAGRNALRAATHGSDFLAASVKEWKSEVATGIQEASPNICIKSK